MMSNAHGTNITSRSNMAQNSDKVKRGRRVWSPVEERTFLECFMEYVVNGGRCENGFKPNYHKELELALKGKLPTCDLKVFPHIDSKIKIWKQQWSDVYDFISKSGNSFNSITKMVDATEEHWTELLQHDKSKYSALKGKAFPMYEDWLEIFGKDRATGEMSFAGNEEVGLDEIYASEWPEMDAQDGADSIPSRNESPVVESGSKRAAKLGKRKASWDPLSLINNLSEKLDSVAATSNQTFMNAAAMFCGNPEDRKAASAIIRNMSLSPRQKGEVSSIILNDQAKVECFLSMNHEEQLDWVAELIQSL